MSTKEVFYNTVVNDKRLRKYFGKFQEKAKNMFFFFGDLDLAVGTWVIAAVIPKYLSQRLQFRAADTGELQEWLEYKDHIVNLHEEIGDDDLPF